MITIYKYKLSVDTEIILPLSAEILSVGCQTAGTMEEKEDICIWIKINTELQLYKRYFKVYGTGHEINEETKQHKFIGTVQMKNGLVWHIFEQLPLIN